MRTRHRETHVNQNDIFYNHNLHDNKLKHHFMVKYFYGRWWWSKQTVENIFYEKNHHFKQKNEWHDRKLHDWQKHFLEIKFRKTWYESINSILSFSTKSFLILYSTLRYLEIIHYTKIRNTFPQLYFDANIRVQSIIA